MLIEVGLQLNFIFTDWQIDILEDTSDLKFAVHRKDGNWNEQISVPELKAHGYNDEENENDHLVVEITQLSSRSEIAVYFGCSPQGRIQMPYSLRDMTEEVKNSKVKVYHGEDIDFSVYDTESTDSALDDLGCRTETMQAQEASPNQRGRDGGNLYSYRRGDIPIFNFEEADRILIATLQELIEALRKLKEETNNHRRETTALKKALQECKACRIKRPECSDDPGPCFPGVDCRDTADGPVCGPCPPGYDGDGRFCERNVCAEQPCFRGVQCFDSADPPYFRCGPCPPGYRGDGVACMPDPCQAKPPPCFRVSEFLGYWLAAKQPILLVEVSFLILKGCPKLFARSPIFTVHNTETLNAVSTTNQPSQPNEERTPDRDTFFFSFRV